MYVQTKDLPDSITSALKSAGYHSKDINVEARDTVSMLDCGGQGRRAFVTLVDIATGRSETHMGSWGGANMFNPRNAVDLDDTERPIPPGVAVIKGSEGESVFATLYLNPENLVKYLPVPPTVSDREKSILGVMGYTSAYRKDELQRMKVAPSELDALVAKGWLKPHGKGYTLTTEGKNARGRNY